MEINSHAAVAGRHNRAGISTNADFEQWDTAGKSSIKQMVPEEFLCQ